MKNAANTPLSATPDGPAICSRCGGQLINIQDSPIIPSNLASRSESDPNQVFSSQASHSSQFDLPSPKRRDAEHSSHVQGAYGTDNEHRVRQEFKRRRTSSHHVSKPRTQGSLSDVEVNRRAYSKLHVSRSGNTNPSYWGFPPTYSVPLRRAADDEKDFCQRLTLPPLQTNLMAAVGSPRSDRTNNSSLILFKIKTLSKIAPALNMPWSDHNFSGRGVVIAVDGQHPKLVNTVVKSLGKLLIKDGKYTVNVFEGPNIKSQPGGGVNEYLQVIETWHRISKEIVQFVNTKSDREEPERIADSSSSEASLGVDASKPCSSSVVSPDWSIRNGKDKLENAPMAKANPPIPIALISQYQLTTADSFAHGVQIRDRYNPVEHWQWMASLWRGCVGPDATVYIKDCGIEEIGQYGGGNNPVEDRLSDAKSLLIRRLADSSSDIEERALRRVGFEIEDWLTR
jgi:HMG box factor, other